MRQRVERCFGIVIDLKEHTAINKDYVFSECVGFPYALAARVCLLGLKSWLDHHVVTEPVEIVFEDGAKHKGQINGWHSATASYSDFKSKWECPTSFLPLQVADLIAGEIGNHLATVGAKNEGYSDCLHEINHTLDRGWAIVDLERMRVVLDLRLEIQRCNISATLCVRGELFGPRCSTGQKQKASSQS